MFDDVLERLGIEKVDRGASYGPWIGNSSGPTIDSINPANGNVIAKVQCAAPDDYETIVARAQESFLRWRMLPPPNRGEIVREIGLALRRHKEDLGMLVTLETGKILSEGEGEVQEMIDMCDFAVGLSRQLYGLTIASERAHHRMMEVWHPLGPIGVITAFNFPVAVWAWNAAVAAVCGDTIIWKPSQRTPLTAIAVQKIINRVMAEHAIEGVFNLCVGGADIGEAMARDARLPLISATGSSAMGRKVGAAVAARTGRALLELGGNNGMIVTPSANLDLALRAVLFAAVGTAGQRCTTLRRLIVHRSIEAEFTARLANAYKSVRIGDPWNQGTLMGPLISPDAVDTMMHAIQRIKDEGGEIIHGGNRLDRPGNFVEPTIVRANADMSILREETFAPILYVLSYDSMDEALQIHNSVDQGLSSAIFTGNLQEAELFLSPRGSDSGIANVNIGTSGAEIGGAFGGEKETGGGREAGSDSWKAYMRRQTCTINYGNELPLAQGVKFDVI